MKSIKIHDKAYVQGLGHRVNRNCKAVGVRELNRVFDSVQEAAEYLGAHPVNVSLAANGKQKTTRGYHVYFVKEVTEHFDEVLEFNRNESEKKNKQLAEMEMENAELRKEAALWRAHLAKEEAKRKAREMEHDRLCKEYDDAKGNRERLEELLEHLKSEMSSTVEAIAKANETEQEAKSALLEFEKKMKEE